MRKCEKYIQYCIKSSIGQIRHLENLIKKEQNELLKAKAALAETRKGGKADK